jgi:alcohol dehydrogenase (NADP+)
MGGYADYARVPSEFVFKIPDGLPSEVAGPLMCGGVTVYSPIKQLGVAPGKTLGVIGIGGLGHMAIIFAKALGAEVVAISTSERKKEDAFAMGATKFIATNEGKAVFKQHRRSLDYIGILLGKYCTDVVCTANSPDMPVQDYLTLLKVGGTQVFVGIPEQPIPNFSLGTLIMNGVFMGGSMIGSPNEIREMLDLAATQNIKPWIECRSLSDANQAVVDMERGKARYRYCLVNEKHLAQRQN